MLQRLPVLAVPPTDLHVEPLAQPHGHVGERGIFGEAQPVERPDDGVAVDGAVRRIGRVGADRIAGILARVEGADDPVDALAAR